MKKNTLLVMNRGVTFHSLLVYSLKLTRCSLIVVKPLVIHCKIRLLLVANIYSLLVAEVAHCKKSLVTRCKIRSLLVSKLTRYLLQKLLVAKNHSLVVAKFACYLLQQITCYSMQKNYSSLVKTKSIKSS